MLQSPSPPVGTGEGGGLRNKELEVSRRKREGRKEYRGYNYMEILLLKSFFLENTIELNGGNPNML